MAPGSLYARTTTSALRDELVSGFDVELLATALNVELLVFVLEVKPRPMLNVELLGPVMNFVVPGLVLEVEVVAYILAVELEARTRGTATAIRASTLDVELLEDMMEIEVEPARSEVELESVPIIVEDVFEMMLKVDDEENSDVVLKAVLPGSIVNEVLDPTSEDNAVDIWSVLSKRLAFEEPVLTKMLNAWTMLEGEAPPALELELALAPGSTMEELELEEPKLEELPNPGSDVNEVVEVRV